MPVVLPLTLIGLSLIVYYLFASATYALPLIIGLAVGFGATALGMSAPTAVAIGILGWLFAIATGEFAGRTLTGPIARIAIPALFAIPAAIAGYSVASGLTAIAGLGALGTIVAPLAAIGCAAIAAQRVSQPAS